MMKIAIPVLVALLVVYAEAVDKKGICQPKTDLIVYFLNCTQDANISSIPDVTKIEKGDLVDMMVRIIKCTGKKLKWHGSDNDQLNEENVMESVEILSTIPCLQDRLRSAFKLCLNSDTCDAVSKDVDSKELCLWRQYNAVCEVDDHDAEKKNCDYDPKILNLLLGFMDSFSRNLTAMAQKEKELNRPLSDIEKFDCLCPPFTDFLRSGNCFDENSLSEEKTYNFFDENIKSPNETTKSLFLEKVTECFQTHKNATDQTKPCLISFCVVGVYDKVCKVQDPPQEKV